MCCRMRRSSKAVLAWPAAIADLFSKRLTTTSAAMPQSTGSQQSSPTPPRKSRTNPHPTRHRSKGRGAAARRKERRRVARAPVMSPGFSSSLSPQAQPFIPYPSHPPHIPEVMHVVHWFQHVGFPGLSPWDGLPWDSVDWPQPYFH